MKELPLNALRAFAVVYARGGVRAAARQLGIAHSSVSRHLAELEAWLGIALTQKEGTPRRLDFTPQGEALAKATLEGLQQIASQVDALREAKSARSVLVGAAPSFAMRWLLPRLPELERRHPRLEVSVIVEKRLDDLQAAGVDVAIRMGAGPFPGARCEPLMDDALYPVMSPTYWRKVGRPTTPADLAGLRLLHDRDPHATWEAWRQAHGPATLDVHKGPRLTSTNLVLTAALQGQGVALARHQLAANDIAAGLLCRPLGALQVDLPRAYWLLTPKHTSLRPATSTVIAWLQEEAARQAAEE